MKRRTSRRRFLSHSLALGGLGALGGIDPWIRLAHGAPGILTVPGVPINDRYYIFCKFSGGWDTLLSLDPRDPELFTSANENQTLINPGYDLLVSSTPDGGPVYRPNTPLGPMGGYMGDLLKPPYVDQIAVVRGLNMMTLAHDVGSVRARTGRPPTGTSPRGSSAASWFAYHYGASDLIPNLALYEDVYNTDLPNFVTPLTAHSVTDLVSILTPTQDPLSPLARDQVNQLLANAYACPSAQASPFKQASVHYGNQASIVVEQDLGSQFDVMAETAEMQAIRDLYGIQMADSGQARAALAVRAITSGACRCASVVVTTGLDGHEAETWDYEQGTNQALGFNTIARMIDDLSSTEVPDGSGDSYFDRTNIIAYSEFSRTPRINAYGGRDHWLANAFLLAGADIQGGQVIGATSNVGMEPMPIDVTTGQIDPVAGVTLRPAHIYQALFYAAGFDMNADPADMRVDPLLPLLKP